MKGLPMNASHYWLGGLACGLLISVLDAGAATPGRDPFAPQRLPPCADVASLTLGGIVQGGEVQHAWLRDAAGHWQKVMPGVRMGTTGWQVEQITAGGVKLTADPDVCPAPGTLRLQWEK
ncbi:DUF2531 domain-containing protein [Chimaeribacter arupi]|uniref:DUF2531 domain-containing protein n=2 Tax=Enterobacterales TaxID=91347 RepID=A0A2N5EP94_9GAMM|nr:DUF2531 domain-containing protein [Chimaeribacter arupi]PLR50333.1 DUF2531 domain-containing protein [Chimaeribacter arupi]PLR51108.1 DUF2531 domain-containing protein [Chimaeribacter arupi]